MHAEGAVFAWLVCFGHSQFFASFSRTREHHTEFSKMLDAGLIVAPRYIYSNYKCSKIENAGGINSFHKMRDTDQTKPMYYIQ